MRISDWSSDVCSSDLVLGLDDDTVRSICARAAQDEVVEAVNFNAPAQVVIAGHKAAVERACELAKAEGAKRALVLAVSAPFHSSLLKPAAAVLEQALAGIELAPAQIPRSEEHTSELQSLMRISYAVFCLKKKTQVLPTKHQP